MKQKTLTHFDLFSGYGGFTLALEVVYENNSGRKCLPKQGSGGNNSKSNWDSTDILGRQKGRDSEHPLCSTIGFSEINKYASAVLK